MFGKLYAGELKKQTSKSAIIAIAVIMAVLLLLMAVLFDSLNELLAESVPPSEAQSRSAEVYTEESVEALLEYYRAALKDAEAEKAEAGFDYYRNPDSVYMYEGYIAMLEYIKGNELYGIELTTVIQGAPVTGASVTAESFITTAGSMLILLAVIYASIVAGSTFADEYKRGTIKMLLIRPVGRGQVVTAKLLAALTHTAAAYLIMFVCTVAVGYAVFPAAGGDAVYSFNNSAFTVSAVSNTPGISFATNLIMLMTYAVVAFAAGILTRNKVFGIITPIILIEVAGLIISMFGLGRFFISDAAEWSKYVGIGNTLYGGADFFISLAVWIVWVAVLTAGSYIAVIKRDAA